MKEKNENIFTLKDDKGNEVEFERLFTFDSDITKKVILLTLTTLKMKMVGN